MTFRAFARDDASWRAFVDAFMLNGWNVYVLVVYFRFGVKN